MLTRSPVCFPLLFLLLLFTLQASVLSLLAFPHVLLPLVGITLLFPHISLTVVSIPLGAGEPKLSGLRYTNAIIREPPPK